MRLGPSLVGALVGAVVGIAVQVGVESGLGMESTWLAIVIGILTGLGARTMAGEYIQSASYLRGALAAIIALGGILGGSYAASSMIRKNNVDSMESLQPVDVDALKAKERAGEEEIAEDADDIEAADDTELTEPADNAEQPAENPDAAEDDSAGVTATEDEAQEDATEEAGDEEEPASAEASDAETDEADTDTAEADGEEESDQSTREAEEAFSLRGQQARPTAGERLGQTTKTVPFSTTQAIFMGLGVFLAYEFARGGGKGSPQPSHTEHAT